MNLSEAAKKYIGIPFRHRGRTDRGLDCIGLVVRSIQDCGGEVEDRRDYGREPWNDGLREALRSNLTRVDRDPRQGDVVLMKIRASHPPSHVAIVSDYPHGGLGLIHSRSEFQKVVFHSLNDKMRENIVEVYEWEATLPQSSA